MSSSSATPLKKDTKKVVEETVNQAQDNCESSYDTAKKQIVDKANEAKEACNQYATHVKKTVKEASDKIIKPIEEKKDAAIKYTNNKKAAAHEKVQGVRTQVSEKKAVVQEKVESIRTQVSETSTAAQAKAQNIHTQVAAAQEKLLGAVEGLKGEPAEAGKIENTLVSVATFAAKTSVKIACIGLEALGMKEYTQKRLHSTNTAIWKFVNEHPRISSTGTALAAYWPIKIGHRAVSKVSANIYA
jgi:hypothetical protein